MMQTVYDAMFAKMTGFTHAEFCFKYGKIFKLGNTRKLMIQILVFIGNI